MPNLYEQALKGTENEAAEIVANIERELLHYGESGHKNARKHQLKYCSIILRSICVAASTEQGVHYELYCDIVERILTPSLDPAASPKDWGLYLENMRYLHHLFVNKKLFKEAWKIYACLASQKQKLQSETDFKPILATYCLHLMLQNAHWKRDPSAAQREISHTLDALTVLFNCMLQCNAELNFVYDKFVELFAQCLGKQSTSLLIFFSTCVPAEQKQAMFEAFFTLMVGMKMPVQEEEAVYQHYQRSLDAFLNFMKIDCAGEMQQPVTLQYLRASIEQKVFQSNNGIHYTLNLLYYYLKFIYTQVKFNNFVPSYVELCSKIKNFFEKSGAVLLEHKWFMDFLVAFTILAEHVHQRVIMYFEPFWQQMNNTECYLAHFELLLCCIKLAPQVTESKLAAWNCCTSVRKHMILSLVQSAFGAYSFFMLNTTDTTENEALTLLNKNFATLVRHAVNIINSMSCIIAQPTSLPASSMPDPSASIQSNDLRAFYIRIIQLTKDVKTPEQARYCVTVMDVLEKLQQKFPPTIWTQLLRRFYKTAELTGDTELTAELHSCYIAGLLQESQQLDWMQLRNQILIFYTKHTDRCVLECHAQCSSPLKPPLLPAQKHLLHWLEAQHVLRYHKTAIAVQKSLLQHCSVQYEYVLIWRAGKIMDTEVVGKLTAHCEELKQKRHRGSRTLKRLEWLTLGHVYTQLLHEQNDAQKKKFEIDSKDCAEDKLDALLQRKELRSINVHKELEIVQFAVEALRAFIAFYNMADLELISSDEAYIDWEALLDDVAALAQYFQFSGYLKYATEAWCLHYRICNTIDDSYNSLRALSYFCEHVGSLEPQDTSCEFNLQQEVAAKLPEIVEYLKISQQLIKRQQTQLLVCVCQLAYYYAHLKNLSYAQMLLLFVQRLHAELPERKDKYDLVLSTLDAVKIRILWKHYEANQGGSAAFLSLTGPLLRQVETTLDNFREFVYISSSDTLPYMILLFGLAQQVAECTANRLSDYHINNLFMSVLKVALQSGAALRLVQILTMWMWTNLQMEYVTKAQTKLKIIECTLGIKNLYEFVQITSKNVKPPLTKSASLPEPPVAASQSMQLNLVGVEAMRKVVPTHSFPIKESTLQLSPSGRSPSDLKRFLYYGRHSTLQDNEMLQWCNFAVGCLNARLYYLTDDHTHLEDFYEQCLLWLDQGKSAFYRRNFENFQLLCLQHYANVLRAQKKYEKAVSLLEDALQRSEVMQHNVDSMYRLNFLLQLQATKQQLAQRQTSVRWKDNDNRLSRALEYSTSPDEPLDERTKVQQDKSTDVMCKLYGTTVKKPKGKVQRAAFVIYHSDEEEEAIKKHSRKKLFQSKPVGNDNVISVGSSSSSSSSSNSSIELNYTPSGAQKSIFDLPTSTEVDKLNLCQAIDVIDLTDSDEESPTVVAKCHKAGQAARSKKPAAAKVSRQLQRSAATQAKSKTTPCLLPVATTTPSAATPSKFSVIDLLASGATSASAIVSSKRPTRRRLPTCADVIKELAMTEDFSLATAAAAVAARTEFTEEHAAAIELQSKLHALETPMAATSKTPSTRRARKLPQPKQECWDARSGSAAVSLQPVGGASSSISTVTATPLKSKASKKASSSSNSKVAKMQAQFATKPTKTTTAAAAATVTTNTTPVSGTATNTPAVAERRTRGRQRQTAKDSSENIAPLVVNYPSSAVSRRRQRT